MKNTNDPKTKFAINTVRIAACLAGDIQGEMVSEALTKNDRSPVTVADFAAQAVVGYFLEKEFPGALLVGEEQADVLRAPQERETLKRITEFVGRVIPDVNPDEVCDFIDRGVSDPGDKYWTLDPVDGTKGFLRGAQYACALAYIEEGKVQLGVLGCPNMSPELLEDIGGEGSLLYAMRGQGSWITSLRNEDNQYSKLTTSSRSNPEDARLVGSFVSAHTNVSQVDLFQQALGGKADPVRIDSQVKYALLAAGQGDVYLRFLSPDMPDYKEKIWDQAAGSVIVEEAGGRVTDIDGKPLDFSQGRTLKENRGICATNSHLHELAISALREINS